jgi:hypothetical protein
MVTACSDEIQVDETRDPGVRQEIQRSTESLYWVHLRLDTARSALQEADLALSSGQNSAAAYHLAEAIRVIEQADDRVLEMGTQMQQAFGLDRD